MSGFEIDPNWLRYPITNSSQIKEIAFNKADKRLYVRFHNNSIYSYKFTFEQFEEFRKSESIGKYFYANIKKLTTTKMKNGS